MMSFSILVSTGQQDTVLWSGSCHWNRCRMRNGWYGVHCSGDEEIDEEKEGWR